MTLTPEFVAEVAGKLTKPRRDLLALAARSPDGNPWPLIGMGQRAGGATQRMFEAMQRLGLFGDDNCLTPLGLAVRDHLNGEKG